MENFTEKNFPKMDFMTCFDYLEYRLDFLEELSDYSDRKRFIDDMLKEARSESIVICQEQLIDYAAEFAICEIDLAESDGIEKVLWTIGKLPKWLKSMEQVSDFIDYQIKLFA
ncbi:MAG: hypothetical protein KAR42_18085 [candidate division Zixibacteria bacterium]|nr:hypothetical protein [candidate division Zixibacteria bacterium]